MVFVPYLIYQTVPFSGRIRGGMKPGKKIIIMGIIDPEPDRYVFILKLHKFKTVHILAVAKSYISQKLCLKTLKLL